MARKTEVIRRHLPSRDIARGFTGWGISLQLRAVGAMCRSLLTIFEQTPPIENAAAQVAPAPEPIP